MTASVVAMALMLAGVILAGAAVLINWRIGKIERAVRSAQRLHSQNQRVLEDIAGSLGAAAAASSNQPAQLLESAAQLRGAAEQMRWQFNNRELLLNDQLELLSQQARALARLRYEAITLHGDAGGAECRETTPVDVRPSGYAARAGVPAEGSKVVTLKEHLRQL